jgi:hypothetical protein
MLSLSDGSIVCCGAERSSLEPYVSSDNTFFVDSAKVVLACAIKNANIFYTLDGSEPNQSSTLYKRPFTLTETRLLKMRTFSNQFPPSFVVSQEFKKVDYAKAVAPGEVEIGLEYDYFEGAFNAVANLDSLKPDDSGLMTSFKLEPRGDVNEFGYIYRGYLLVPVDGIYTFFIESNDGSKLYINNAELIDNDGGHSAKEESGKIALRVGEYALKVKYFQMGAGKMLRVSWEGPGFKKQDITAEVLFHKVMK